MTDPHSPGRDYKPKSDRSIFADLLATSHAIKHALAPVDARPSFVTKLREDINANVEHARTRLIRHQQRRDKIRWATIGAGLAVYTVGFSVIMIRLVRWGLSRFRKPTHSSGS